MLKYVQRFADVKTISTFASVLIQTRYTSELYHIHKKLLYNTKQFYTMETLLVFLIILFFGYLFFSPTLKDTTNHNF